METSVQALASLVKEGKIGGIGLSEVNANTIRKAHAVHPISAVEIELSLFTTDPLHNGIMETCDEREYEQIPDHVYHLIISSIYSCRRIQSSWTWLVDRQIQDVRRHPS
jgi:predicted oxidoreductase